MRANTKAFHFSVTVKILSSIYCALLPFRSTAAEFWVSPLGSDDKGCTNSTTDACKTIQKGVGKLNAGDILNMMPGVYSEDGGRSAFNTSGNTGFMSQTGQGNIASAAVVLLRSGTSSNPITIRTDPSSSGQAVIDCGHVYQGTASYLGGIFVNRQDYVHLKNFTIRNCMSRAIYDADRGDNSVDVPNLAVLSVGVVVDGLTIHHIGGADNDAGVAMWTTKDWIVRNNYIYDIYGWPPNGRFGAGVMSYGTVNALIEHNKIEDSAGGSGIFWKDHYVADAVTRAPVVESEIRYNLINVKGIAVMIGVQPDNEAGENYIHHNVLVGAGRDEGNAIRIHMSSVALPTTATQRIEHNLLLGRGALDTAGIMISGTKDVRLRGNIVSGFNVGVQAQNYSDAMPVALKASDFNAWGTLNAIAILGRYSSIPAKSYANLSLWKSATTADTLVLGQNNPDAGGVQATIDALIASVSTGDYRLKAGSPAAGILPDGSNAGPYQFGTEVIGINTGVQLQSPPAAPDLNIE